MEVPAMHDALGRLAALAALPPVATTVTALVGVAFLIVMTVFIVGADGRLRDDRPSDDR